MVMGLEVMWDTWLVVAVLGVVLGNAGTNRLEFLAVMPGTICWAAVVPPSAAGDTWLTSSWVQHDPNMKPSMHMPM